MTKFADKEVRAAKKYSPQRSESPEKIKERKNRLLLCRYAALGHPNRQGALLYSDAITNLLKTIPGGLAASR